MSSFTENLYLKRHLKQLQEENLKLKRTINEVYGQGAYPNPNDRAVDSVDLKPSDLEPMEELDLGPTPEELEEFEKLFSKHSPEELIRRHGKAGTVDLRSLTPYDQYAIGAAHAAEQPHQIPANPIDNFGYYAAGVARGRRFF